MLGTLLCFKGWQDITYVDAAVIIWCGGVLGPGIIILLLFGAFLWWLETIDRPIFRKRK